MQQEHIELPCTLDSKYAESMPILEYGICFCLIISNSGSLQKANQNSRNQSDWLFQDVQAERICKNSIKFAELQQFNSFIFYETFHILPPGCPCHLGDESTRGSSQRLRSN